MIVDLDEALLKALDKSMPNVSPEIWKALTILLRIYIDYMDAVEYMKEMKIWKDFEERQEKKYGKKGGDKTR